MCLAIPGVHDLTCLACECTPFGQFFRSILNICSFDSEWTINFYYVCIAHPLIHNLVLLVITPSYRALILSIPRKFIGSTIFIEVRGWNHCFQSQRTTFFSELWIFQLRIRNQHKYIDNDIHITWITKDSHSQLVIIYFITREAQSIEISVVAWTLVSTFECTYSASARELRRPREPSRLPAESARVPLLLDCMLKEGISRFSCSSPYYPVSYN